MISAMVLKMGLAFGIVLYFLFTFMQMVTWKAYVMIAPKKFIFCTIAGTAIAFILLNWRAILN